MGLFKKKEPDPQLVLRLSKLLEEANQLANTINTTIDEKTFFGSYERLITIFTDLVKYENTGIFTSSPKSDLQSIIRNRQVAIEKFYSRQKSNVKHKNSDTQLPQKRVLNVVDARKTNKYSESELLSLIDSANLYDIDPYLMDAGNLLIPKGKASVGMIQRYFKVGFNRAARIMDQLERIGVVDKEDGTAPRKILMSLEDFYELYKMLSEKASVCPEHKTGFSYTVDSDSIPEKCHIMDYDSMSGTQFESFCKWLLCEHNFTNVETTKASGDHGIDILAEKDDITYAIQCKCYSSNIGNAAVQQAHTGKSLYNRDIAVVLTNQYFTSQAKEEASVLGVKLWDRDKLNEMIEKSSLNNSE